MGVNAREKKSFYICVLYVYRLLYISLSLFSLMYSYKKVTPITPIKTSLPYYRKGNSALGVA